MIRYIFYALVAYLLIRFIQNAIRIYVFIRNIQSPNQASQKKSVSKKQAVEMHESKDGTFYYTDDE